MITFVLVDNDQGRTIKIARNIPNPQPYCPAEKFMVLNFTIETFHEEYIISN